MAKKQKDAKEKPLEKMTAPELREMAKKIEGITGTYGMNKAELIHAIQKDKGIENKGVNKSSTGTIREIKAKMRELKRKRNELLESDDSKMADIFRHRISKLKKKTRRV
jgi:protein-arginine kinase activator protein McsA